ncbi:MAG: cytochrome C oxidase subunit IV family protein [Bacteroidetes bacterium]|nr:cytochrome C oxidase subunit IV family protein [Bacteroidota bacterium]
MSDATVNTVSGHAEPDFSTKAIWRTFWILLIITLIELGLAILYYETHFLPKHFLNGLFIIGTLAKAFFIIAEFMHLRHEAKSLIMTLVFPSLLFIWFLIAFLWDGNSYRELRNRYDSHHVEQSKTPVGKKPGVE